MERSVILAVAGSLALLAVATAGPVVLSRSVRAARPQFPFFNPYVNVPNGNPLQAGIGVQTPVAGVDLSIPSGLTVTRGQQQAPQANPGGSAPVAQPQPAYQNNFAPFGGVGNTFGAPQDQGLGNRYDGPTYNAQPTQGSGFGNNFNAAPYNAQPTQGQGFGNNFNTAPYNAQPAQGQGFGNNFNSAPYNAQPAQGQGFGNNFNAAPYNVQPAQGQGLGNNAVGAFNNAQPAQEEGLGMRIDETFGNGQPGQEFLCDNYDPSLSPPSDPAAGDATEHPCAGIGGGNKINPKQAALLSLVG